MAKEKIMFTIEKEMLDILDEQVLKASKKNKGRAFNRSEYICEALDYYFRIRLGIPYIKKHWK